MIDEFIAATLGDEARRRYRICIDAPGEVGRLMSAGMEEVLAFRQDRKDAYFYNWQLEIDPEFQTPFHATHESMAGLNIHPDLPNHELAANLRRAFSGIVAGNIRDDGIQAIEEHGPFEIRGDAGIMQHLDKLLSTCVAQGRMRLPGKPYEPCYRVVS